MRIISALADCRKRHGADGVENFLGRMPVRERDGVGFEISIRITVPILHVAPSHFPKIFLDTPVRRFNWHGFFLAVVLRRHMRVGGGFEDAKRASYLPPRRYTKPRARRVS